MLARPKEFLSRLIFALKYFNINNIALSLKKKKKQLNFIVILNKRNLQLKCFRITATIGLMTNAFVKTLNCFIASNHLLLATYYFLDSHQLPASYHEHHTCLFGIIYSNFSLPVSIRSGPCSASRSVWLPSLRSGDRGTPNSALSPQWNLLLTSPSEWL